MFTQLLYVRRDSPSENAAGTLEPGDTEYSSHITDSSCVYSFLPRQSADSSAFTDIETTSDLFKNTIAVFWPELKDSKFTKWNEPNEWGSHPLRTPWTGTWYKLNPTVVNLWHLGLVRVGSASSELIRELRNASSP